jgi:protein-disulfide isomerase
MTKTLIAAAALAACMALPALAQTDMTDDQRAAFRAEVRAYLMENPEVLMEAIDVLNQRRDSAAGAKDAELLADNADAIFKDPASWVGGNPNGDITVVEFMDYRCGYCKKAHSEVAELINSDGNIRYIVKEFPILGEASVMAARFAVAVLQLEGPEVYKNVHDAMMTLRGDMTPDALTRIAEEQGVKDLAAVNVRMKSDEVSAVIDANHALGATMEINGTPTFIVDGVMLRGYVPLDDMRQVVEQQRKG